MILPIVPFVPLPPEGAPAYDLFMATFLIALIITVPFAIYELRKMRRKRAVISNWIPCKAKVLKLEFVNGDNDPEQWRMRIRYQYEHGGKTYIGRIATFADLEEHPDWHLTDGDTTSYLPAEYERLRHAQKNDDEFQIWINPDSPDQSVITNAQSKGQEIFGYIMILLGLGAILYIFNFAQW